MPTYTPWGYAQEDYPTVEAYLAAHPDCAQGWPAPRVRDPLPGRYLTQHPLHEAHGLPSPEWTVKFCRPNDGLSSPENTANVGNAVAYDHATGRVHVLESQIPLAYAQTMLRESRNPGE